MGGILRGVGPFPGREGATEWPEPLASLGCAWLSEGRQFLPSALKRLLLPSHHLLSFPVLTSGSAEGSLQKAEKVLKKVLEWNKEDVPNKDELVGNLYSCMGNAQMELGQMVAALQSHRKDLEIAKE